MIYLLSLSLYIYIAKRSLEMSYLDNGSSNKYEKN
jgi:hypothetical protein